MLAWLIIALSISVFGLYCRSVIAGGGVENVDFYDACDYYYGLNDRTNVRDPPVWLQEKRFDLARAARMSMIEENPPAELDRYTTLPAKSTTVHVAWNVDHVTLGDMCNWLIKAAQYCLHPQSESKTRERAIAVMTDFAHRYASAMEGKFDRVFPWGSNWYEFSITSTLMLFYLILATSNEKERTFAADLILKIITDPRHSLGRERTQANSVNMALPWITAHFVKGDAYEAARDPAYEYARSYLKFQVVENRKDEGLYMDCAYITHTNVLAYGYLSEMACMSLPLIGLDNQMRNFLLDWRRCQRTLAHRAIPYGGIGFHSRDRRLTQMTVGDSAYGIEVIPTCLFLRMYGEDYAFSMRGQVPWIAYYESDKTYDDMAQYWVQCRRVFFKGEKYEATFPDVGFVHQKYVDLDETTEVSTRCRIPTRTSTTTSFVNGPKRNTQALKSGFVFAYGNVGILRHFYNCAEMIYNPEFQFFPPTDEVHGRFYVDEFVLCDYEKHTVDIWIHVMQAVVASFVLHGSKPVDMSGVVGIFHLRWDCVKRTLTEDYRELKSMDDEIATVYPKGIRVVDTDNTVMLVIDGQPKMAMYPDDWLELKSNFVTKWEGREYEFAFDSLTNQYCLAGQCVEK